MDATERKLLWLGVEDYTGLWDAVLEAEELPGVETPSQARAFALHVIEAFLSRGWFELFRCPEPLSNESVELVSGEDLRAVLDRDASWQIPEPYGTSVRFATTDAGEAAYREEIGW